MRTKNTADLCEGKTGVHLDYLQLGRRLRLLQDGLHARSFHNIASDLQFPGHEQLLCLCLPTNQLSELLLRQHQGN